MDWPLVGGGPPRAGLHTPKARVAPRKPNGDERPTLLSSAQAASWRERITKEEDAAARLGRMINRNRRSAAERLEFEPAMPTPPTSFAKYASRLRHAHERENAARAVYRINKKWPCFSGGGTPLVDEVAVLAKYAAPSTPRSAACPWRT